MGPRVSLNAVENIPFLGTEPRFLGLPARGLVNKLTGPSRRRNNGNDCKMMMMMMIIIIKIII